MKKILKNKKIAFIGGGRACKVILQIFLGDTFAGQRPDILGVADINQHAVGLKYAQNHGIFTVQDYRELFNLPGLNLIIELTGSEEVRAAISKAKPADISLMDHIDAMYVWDFVQIEEKKLAVQKALREGVFEKKVVHDLFDQFSNDLSTIVKERTKSLQKIKEGQELRNRELSSLCSIYTALGSSLQVKDRLRAVTDEIIRSLNVDSLGIYLKEKGVGNLRLIHANGYSHKFWKQDRKLGDGLLGKAAEEGNVIIIEDITTSKTPYRKLILEEGLQSVAYIPLISKNGNFGVIRISSHTSRKFSQEDKNIFSLIGNRLAVAIENSQLLQKTEQFSQVLEQKVIEKTKKLEETYQDLRKSEKRYRSLFNADPNPIFIVYRDTLKIMDVNLRAQACYQFSKNELLKMFFTDLEYDANHELAEGLINLPAKQSSFYSKRRHKRKDGTPFFVNIHVSSVRHLEKHYLIATTTDITESIEKEILLVQASKMTTLGTMASGMAHELNQPLSVIQISSDYFLKMLKRGETIEKEELRSIAQEMSSQVDRAANIIKHLRDFSRQSDIIITKVNMNDPINDVFRVMGQQLRVHQIETELNLDDKLPPIMADHNRLEQVFLNLVTNAMDAMDDKGISLKHLEWKRLLKIKSFSEDGTVVVIVSDTGKGIPEDQTDKIFEPFFTTKEVGKGTGLGMSISYGIIKDYDGTINVKSEVGKGTIFELRFPSCQ